MWENLMQGILGPIYFRKILLEAKGWWKGGEETRLEGVLITPGEIWWGPEQSTGWGMGRKGKDGRDTSNWLDVSIWEKKKSKALRGSELHLGRG